MKSERVETIRVWKNGVNQSEAIWYSASEKIANQQCVQA